MNEMEGNVHATGRWGPRFAEELDACATALEAGLSRGDLAEFYRTFRATELPFIGRAHEDDAHGLFEACFEILHRFGGISPATALAIENHYYVSSAIATFPARQDPEREARRRGLMEAIFQQRQLVANTSGSVHADKLGTIGVIARREGATVRVAGPSIYTSLATQGDLLIFIAVVPDEGPALFVTPMRGDPRLELGPLLFPTAMVDSDTRPVRFHDLVLPAESLILGAKDAAFPVLIAFEMVWHQLLIPSLYLGAAARAIDEVRRFLRSVSGRDERPLAELDGMVVDVGRLSIAYRGACFVVRQAARALLDASRSPLDPQAVASAFDTASVAKYLATRAAEQIVGDARRIIGARAFTGGSPIERLSQEVMFGPLGPDVSAAIERRLGKQALGERTFAERPA